MIRDWALACLACPDCGSPLTPSEGARKKGTGRYGALVCGRCGPFPVIKGIPRLLPVSLLAIYLERYYPDVLAELRRERSLDPEGEARAEVARTMFSFGYQWTTFSEDHDIWDREYERVMGPVEPTWLAQGRLIGDFGCGMGRMLRRAALHPGRFVGMDLSQAIEAAAETCRDRDNVQLVQADLLHPPFRARSFDTIFSIGVLHHLPGGLRSGLAALEPILREGGFIHAWLYGAQRGDGRDPAALIRRLTSRAPLGAVYAFSWAYAAGVKLLFDWPARGLGRIPGLVSVGRRFPFPSWRGMGLRAMACNAFDFYATPVEHGYVRDDLEAVCRDLTGWELQFEPLSSGFRAEESWNLYGHRAAIPSCTSEGPASEGAP